MLPKKRRVKTADFKELMARSAFGSGPYFSLRWNKSEEATKVAETTFAVVISKKVIALASSRNKIKRKCYHILRDLQKKVKSPYKIIFFAKKVAPKGIEKLSFDELGENIRSILSKNNLLT